jgi:hypothetical protein
MTQIAFAALILLLAEGVSRKLAHTREMKSWNKKTRSR